MIQVIGHKGVVGSATMELLRRTGHEVVGKDKGDRLYEADISFICVPEPKVEEVLQGLASYRGLVVIRSTMPPGKVKEFSEEYGRHICNNPEFLREATALHDALRPNCVVIGECCIVHGDILEDLFKPLLVPIIRVDTTTAEMVKLSLNAYLATLVSFWNQIYSICSEIGVNSHTVGRICALDPRVTDYGAVEHGLPYEGRCLQKDLAQLMVFCREHECYSKLLNAVRLVNIRMKQRRH